MVKRSQREILEELCVKHNITLTQGREIFRLMGKCIFTTINDVQKDPDGFIDINNFKSIHIAKFGKFVPNERYISYLNNRELNKDK